ncbi:hypothetical protein [Streptomyces sp. MP131-18]|uniref:hypothetical protein n=1 Tax=Streptomyces sp. MP131-18 TaxID=1857892 RepID=UPI0009D36956|nr:hypothetical protein [Streptomyces sp. MP131-18]ONK13789.1 hypothetical protein STBA_45620 [Streptomyces sp. MP131-18]
MTDTQSEPAAEENPVPAGELPTPPPDELALRTAELLREAEALAAAIREHLKG